MAENYFGYIDTRGESDVTYNVTPLSTAPAFSAESDYVAGDMCFYQGTLYRFTAAKQAGAWDASCVEEITVAGALDDVVSDIDSALASKSPAIESTASGSLVTVTDGSAVPVVDLTVAIEPVQDLNGYDYPWPEGGRLATPSEERAYYTLGITLFADDGGRITEIENGYSYLDSANTGITLLIGYFAAGTVFSFSADTNVNLFRLLFSTTKVTDTDTVCTNKASVNNNNGHWTFTAEESGYYYAAFYQSDRSNQPWTVENFLVSEGPYSNICPISGWTDVNVFRYAQYDASAAPTLSIDWSTEAGTVYGGSLDVTTGVLTVTDVLFTLDGSEDGWNVDDQSGRTRCYNQQLASVYDLGYTVNNTYIEAITNIFPRGESAASYITNGKFILRQVNNRERIDLNYQGVSTKEEWLAYLSQNPLQVCAKLATPVTYQLTPQEVTTLLGENNIWADTGDVSVTYRADTKLYIDGKIAASQQATRALIAGIETTATATKNYSIGDLLIVGDALYKVTAVITSGETIAEGTNVTATTVAEQLLLLASA